jgi:hypothetical protein
LAVTGSCSQAAVLLNNGQGVFTAGGMFGSGTAARAIALADFNRDGSLDIAYMNAATRGEIILLYNNGNATFGPPQAIFAGDLSADFTIADFSNDGGMDLAIANPFLGQVIILFNDSAGTFQGYTELTMETPDSIAAADFNNDGRADIAATSRNLNAVSLILQRDPFNFNLGGAYFPTGQSPVATIAGSLDGDARADVAVVNHAAGTLTVLLSTVAPPPPPPPPPPPNITLTLTTRLTFTARWVDLQWSGAPSSWVDIYRNGVRLTTAYNTGKHSDRFSRQTHGTFTYKVCVSGTTTQCSSPASITF